nr:YhcN/YlaJ family sporulation lipoprotein [Paenibacillus oenotherae]
MNRSLDNRALTDGNGLRSLDRGTAMDGINRDNTMNGMNRDNTMNGVGTRPARNANNPYENASGRLLKHVSAINGVDKATVVINNRDAIIGIDVKAGANTADVARKVKAEAKKLEPKYNVHVTADKNMHSRIRGMQRQMVPLDGHPVRNFTEDIGILIRDIGRAVTAPLR